MCHSVRQKLVSKVIAVIALESRGKRQLKNGLRKKKLNFLPDIDLKIK